MWEKFQNWVGLQDVKYTVWATFLLFSVPAVSVNLQHSDIIPTYPMTFFISMLGQSRPF
jgi:hypothetical protein